MRIKLDHTYGADEIAALTGGGYTGEAASVSYLTTDTRELEAGDLFAALRGEREDGHAYLDRARAAGAALLLCEKEGARCICVKDTYRALCKMAHAARIRIGPTVVAITGSAGKTTTKNMVSAVLSSTFRTHKTKENQNNLLGTCLTLLSMPQDTEVAVLEMGMNHRGELAELSRIACPDAAIITNIGQAHIGNLGSRENIAKEKADILAGCQAGALCLLPADEQLLTDCVPPSCIRMRIGGKESDCYYENISFGSNTTVADFLCHGVFYPALPLPGTGAHMADCAAFAMAIGQALGVPHKEIRRALSTAKQDALRQEIIRRHGITVIADCYNASPESVYAACTVLCSMAQESGGRRLALLGDMLELGTQTRVLHEAVGRHYAEAGIDYLFTFGAAAENIATGAARAGLPKERIFTNPDPAAPQISAAQIKSVLQKGDILLLKAARAMAAERILSYLSPFQNGIKDGEE